ncbi:serine/threonine-protein kinase [Qipengyuania psychrotolerans]|uniref:Protein kinase n=1 Tax=Qipengyuania psychrotolerans TaxID=2867238 RepID=A0ABX8ZCJ9_9SPHN|nr:serine/threonine-protein kinase [Qipengyuania psychrotolerans]QZD86726.1 protein kinase [Qipengyuania psychrotolerans]
MRFIDGRYLVDTSWGPHKGQLSSVFKAVDSSDQMRDVAIKLFDRAAFDQPTVAEGFNREWKSFEKLTSHDNIAKLLDAGIDEETGARFLVLNWYAEDLDALINETSGMQWGQFWESLGRPILDALVFAYKQGILHRDVKPSNILLDESRRPKVTDFGIAKFRQYSRPGVTLASFKTVPYGPPEDEEFSGETRDVFSFAALCLECVTAKRLESYEDVYESLHTADIPPEIRDVFAIALAGSPKDRHANIEILAASLEREIRRSEAAMATAYRVPISITNSVKDSLKALRQLDSDAAAEGMAFQILQEGCAFETIAAQNDEKHIGLLAAEFFFRAVPNWQNNSLTLIAVAQQPPSQLDRRREKAWSPLVKFSPQSVHNSPEEFNRFVDDFAEFETNRKIRAAKSDEEKLFNHWSSLLHFKEKLDTELAGKITFKKSAIEGQRLRLSYVEDVADEAVGQNRIVRLQNGGVIAGEIERITPDEVILYCPRSQDLSQVPQRGVLELDNRLARTAFKRQKEALDSVRFRRNARPDLKDILIGQATPRPPVPRDIEFFQKRLDEDKKAGLRAAIASRDIVVVEGPPGTGKTKFITELVAQSLADPDIERVLISSQTHVALDHAFAAIEKLAERENIAFDAVRIARPDDERVSRDVEHLLLQKRVDNWLSKAMSRSEEFLLEWAASNNISPEDVRTGLALGDLRKSMIARDLLREDAKSLASELDALLEAKKVQKQQTLKAAEFTKTNDDIRALRERLDVVESELPIAEHRFSKAFEKAKSLPQLDGQIDNMTPEEMGELAEDFLMHSEAGQQYGKLLRLAEEWRQRFGHSSDFHGAYISECNFVGGTCLGVAASAMQSVEFDLCIVDEASKASPTEILVPMAKAKRWVIVGDPNQLPPYSDASPEARKLLAQDGLTKGDLRRTLLDHLISTVPEDCRLSLNTQHRMTRAIGDLVSECFYDRRLNSVNEDTCEYLVKAHAMPKPVTWFDTGGLPNSNETRRRGTFVNQTEVNQIASMLLRLELAASQRKMKYSVAILSGYGGQVEAIERMLDTYRKRCRTLEIEVGTVDSFQGKEADVAIYSVTRSNDAGEIGFLKERERLNVALSRAKIGLAIFGNLDFCRETSGRNPFQAVIRYIEDNPDDCAVEELQ